MAPIPKPHIKPPARQLLSGLTSPPPHLDVRGREVEIANKMIASDKPQLDPDVPEMADGVDMTAAYDDAKAVHNAEFERAAARSQPNQRLPAFTGMSNIDFYPMHYTGSDNVLDDTASVGRTTLFDGLKEFNGQERMEEMARNMADRNRGSGGGALMPAIHPRGIDEHFGRDMFLARTNTSELGNGVIYPGQDVIEFNAADDSAATIFHELQHGRGAHSPFRTAMLDSRMAENPMAWMRYTNGRIGKSGGIIKQIAQAARELGQFKDLDMLTMNVPFLGPTGGMELLHNWQGRYPFKPHERMANGGSFKDLALQRNGFRTLAEAGDEEAFLNHALSQSPLERNPAGVGPTFDYREYNKHLMEEKALHEAYTPKGRKGNMKMLVRLGAAAAPVIAAGMGEDQ